MNSSGIKKIENSHAVQVYASTRSIWRGNLWSSIHVDIKLDKCFLLNENHPGGRFVLRAYLEDSSSKGLYITDDSMHLKLCFNLSRRDNQRFLLVTSDQYNTLDVEVHKELFSCGNTFRVIVVAEDRLDGPAEVIFGASQTITVTDLSLSIEHRFLDSPYCEFVEQNVFAWYSKCGGEQSSLSALVHLKDANGNVAKINDELQLLTELLYEDGSPTPLNPICPLKDRKSGKISDKPLLRLCVTPKLLPGRCSARIGFRIEEVTFHHSGHHGFKLKISPAYSRSVIIHPAISTEIIVVLSKPKSGRRKSDVDVLTTTPTKRRKISLNEEHKLTFEVPFTLLISGYRVNGNCLCCKQNISTEEFLGREAHTDSCAFATLIVPAALGPWHNQKENSDALPFSAPLPLASITNALLPGPLTLNSTTSQTNLTSHCYSIRDASKSKTITKRDKTLDSLTQAWGGAYDLKHNPSNAYYLSTKRANDGPNDCSLFALKDTKEENEKYSLQTHIFSDEARIEMNSTHCFTPQVCRREQADESCIFPLDEELRECNLVSYSSDNSTATDAGDCSIVTLKDSMSMEENEKYLLQAFPVRRDVVHTTYTDTFVHETFNVDEIDEHSLVTLIDTFSSTGQSCSAGNNFAISSSSNIDSYENERVAHIFSSMTDLTPIRLSKFSHSSQSFGSICGLAQDFVDVDSVASNSVDGSSSLLEPIALSVENFDDSNDTTTHELMREIDFSDTATPLSEIPSASSLVDIGSITHMVDFSDTTTPLPEIPSASSLVDVGSIKHMELDFKSQQTNPSTPTKEANRTAINTSHPGQNSHYDNESNILYSFAKEMISPVRKCGRISDR